MQQSDIDILILAFEHMYFLGLALGIVIGAISRDLLCLIVSNRWFIRHKYKQLSTDFHLWKRSPRRFWNGGFTTIELTLVLAILGGLVIYTLEMYDLVAADIEESPFVEYQQHHQEAIKRIRGY